MKRSSFLKTLIGLPFAKVAIDNLEKPKEELVLSTNDHTEMTGTADHEESRRWVVCCNGNCEYVDRYKVLFDPVYGGSTNIQKV